MGFKSRWIRLYIWPTYAEAIFQAPQEERFSRSHLSQNLYKPRKPSFYQKASIWAKYGFFIL